MNLKTLRRLIASPVIKHRLKATGTPSEQSNAGHSIFPSDNGGRVARGGPGALIAGSSTYGGARTDQTGICAAL